MDWVRCDPSIWWSMGKSEMGYADIQSFLNQIQCDTLPVLNITVLRNVILEPVLENYLRYFAVQTGYQAIVKSGEYNNIFQETVGGQPDLLNQATDYILVFSRLETLSQNLSRNFLGLSQAEVETEKEHIVNFVRNVLAGIRKQSNTAVLWHSFELPLYPPAGILESQSGICQAGLVNDLNGFLRQALFETGNAYYVDLNLCLARLGGKNFSTGDS
jgi:predicted enzyme involved in methoxymalonyl-ACP biosynthesis